MKDKDTEALRVYERAEHWPPFTYRNYPDVTPENVHSFINFLGTENTSREKKELQPWIPFCNLKCTFCYFPTEPLSNDRIERYLLALKKALKMYAETRYVKSSEFNEIYFGGGSPSVMSSEQIADLLSYCERNFNLSGDRMVKITGCTYDFDKKKLESMANYGVEQLDLGIQTFDDDIRKMLNLQDNAGEAERTVRTARKLGLRVSIDLMYNLPGQTMEIWKNDIRRALGLDVESVDCYPLEIYPGTTLAKQLQSGEVPDVGDSATEAMIYLEAYNMFAESGYKPTCHNRFSRIADDFEEPCFEILGTGAGFFMGHLGKYSYVDVEPANAYIDVVKSGRFPIAKLSVSSKEDEMRKMMMRLYIRLTVDKEEFRRQFGNLPEEVFADAINRLKKKGLIEVDDREIRLTKLGDVWRVNIAWEFARA
jgi:coproporphyrinogen III oxidase-like Fe-S oxidoreductase